MATSICTADTVGLGRSVAGRARPQPLASTLAIAIGLLWLLASPLRADTSGQLGGVVLDDLGEPLAAVTVEVESPSQIGGAQTTVTDRDGGFYFPYLEPGLYTVRAGVAGLVEQMLADVRVRLDRYTDVRIVLASEAVTETVAVTSATPLVDPQQVSTGQTFTIDYMQETRTDWVDLVEQVPGVDPENSQRVLGSTPEANAYRLDGLDVTNWWGRSPNYAAVEIPFDAVQEVAVHSSGFEAEFGQATGGVVNLITRSGGNQFHGTLDASYRDSDLEESGDHYDPDVQVSESWRVATTLGGPLVRDRAWFFSSFTPSLTRTTPTGAPVTEELDDTLVLARLSWSVSPAWTLSGKYVDYDSDWRNFTASQFIAAEANGSVDNRSTVASLEWVGQFSSRLLWELELGRNTWPGASFPSDGDLTSIRHVNATTLETTASFGFEERWEDRHEVAATTLSWFGSSEHEVSAGASWGRPTSWSLTCWTGSGSPCAPEAETYRYVDRNDTAGRPAPHMFQVLTTGDPTAIDAESGALYLQDTWRGLQGVTVKPGLRWDRVTYSNNTGKVADFDLLQPRLGVSWDLTGNGRNLLRASWGRFLHPSTLRLANWTQDYPDLHEYYLSCTRYVSPDPEACAALARAEGYDYRADPEGWDPAGWILPPENIYGGGVNEVVSNDLEAAFADHWMVGFEREVWRRTTVELSYVDKTAEDLIEDTCRGNEEGPSPDADCTQWTILNLPEARLDYHAWILRFETRATSRLHLLASWVISDSKGSIANNRGGEWELDQYPYHWVNRYGYLPDHSRHRVKLDGYVRFPLDFALAVNAWWSSEQRWTPVERWVPGMTGGVLFLEPRGNREEDGLYDVDLQLSKGFRVGPTRLRAIGAVYNVFDSELAEDFCGNSTGCGAFALGDPIAWQQPRSYELGFRVEF